MEYLKVCADRKSTIYNTAVVRCASVSENERAFLGRLSDNRGDSWCIERAFKGKNAGDRLVLIRLATSRET